MFVFLAVGGSHIDEQYSRVGRTRALYAVSLVLGGQCIKFRFGKPRVLLACRKWFRYVRFSGGRQIGRHQGI